MPIAYLSVAIVTIYHSKITATGCHIHQHHRTVLATVQVYQFCISGEVIPVMCWSVIPDMAIGILYAIVPGCQEYTSQGWAIRMQLFSKRLHIDAVQLKQLLANTWAGT